MLLRGASRREMLHDQNVIYYCSAFVSTSLMN
jgi:hypothetical protein